MERIKKISDEYTEPKCVWCGKTESAHHYGARYCFGTADSESGKQVFRAPTPSEPPKDKADLRDEDLCMQDTGQHEIVGASTFACYRPQGHPGEHERGGRCFKHGYYVGQQCPEWPNCVPPIPAEPVAGETKQCKSPYHRPTSVYCLDCLPPDAPLGVLLLSTREPTADEVQRGLKLAAEFPPVPAVAVQEEGKLTPRMEDFIDRIVEEVEEAGILDEDAELDLETGKRARGREDDCSQSERREFPKLHNEGSSPSEHPIPQWRVGRSVSINVYEGDRPVCQCHTAIDAKRIVEAVNAKRS